MAKRDPSDGSVSEGNTSEDDWIQDDEDADSIGDEDLDIYGDDGFDSEESDEAEAVIERSRQDASGPGQDSKSRASDDVFGKVGTERQSIMAWDAHQSLVAAAPAQRRARPSDTQRARLSDTRKRIPPQSAGRTRPMSRHVRPAQPQEPHVITWDTNNEPVRQVFRGASPNENDEPRHAPETPEKEDTANRERADLLQKEAANAEGHITNEEQRDAYGGGDRESKTSNTAEEEIAVEDETDWETAKDPKIEPEKETSNDLGSKQVQVLLPGESSESEATSEEDGAANEKKVLSIPLTLTEKSEEVEGGDVIVEELPPVAPFIATMHQIVCDPQNWHCVRWGGEGRTLLFADPTTFNLRLIPRYFTGTWRSKCGALNGTAYDFAQVVRTLRTFGFTKVDPSDPDRMEFQHRWFQQHSADALHRLVPRRTERCTSATSAHLMLLPRPWTPVGARPTPARPTTAPGSALQPRPPATPRTPAASGGRAKSAGVSGEAWGLGRRLSVASAQSVRASVSVAGQEVSLERSRSQEAPAPPPLPAAAGRAFTSAVAPLGQGGAGKQRSKFQFLRREQKRRDAELAQRKAASEKKSGAGKLLSVVEMARANRRKSGGDEHEHAASAASSEASHSRGPSPTVLGESPRSSQSRSPGALAQSRSLLHARRKASGEVLVGFWDGGVPGEAGMRVKRSQEGVEHRLRKGTPPGWWTEAVGVITEVETDGRMCLVQWQSGKEEWCCSGFSDLYYLQQFIVKNTDSKHASTWKKEARLGPQWFMTGQGVWRMNRLKSQLKVNMHSVEREAAADKLLPSVRKMVGRYFVSEAARRKEEQRVRAKLQRRQQRNAGEAPRSHYTPKPSTISLTEGTEARAIAEIDHVEGVGEFFRTQGPMERIVAQGLVSQLGRALRKAYGDCAKLPNGTLSLEAVEGAVAKMGLKVSRASLLEGLKVEETERGHVTLDVFLDCMYHVLQRIAPRKPRTPLRASFAPGAADT